MLRVIKASQRLGFTLDEVADLLAAGSHRHGQGQSDAGLQARARTKLAEVEQKMADLAVSHVESTPTEGDFPPAVNHRPGRAVTGVDARGRHSRREALGREHVVPTPLTRILRINGENRTVTVADEGEQLLYVLRNRLGQRGPKFGCGVAQCGACTVLIDGEIRRSCVTPLRTVPDGASVTTLDGLDANGSLHPLQRTFIEQQAAQCAFCVNGIIMGAAGWLQQRKASGVTTTPTDDEIAAFLSGETAHSTFNYLCRCGAHTRMIRAIRLAAEEVLR